MLENAPEQHTNIAEGNSGEAPIVQLHTQLERVMHAFVIGNNPLTELHALDTLFDTTASEANTLVETTALRLCQQPNVFENLNCQSSLLTGCSKFFSAVLRKMGDLAETHSELADVAALPVQIRLVEHYRQKNNGREMQQYAGRVESALQEKISMNDVLVLAQLAKVRYEESMFVFAQQDFADAIAKGEESVQLCEKAVDLYGVLAARGNTAGLFRYTWARSLDTKDAHFGTLLNEGKKILESDLTTTNEQLTRHECGTAEHRNFERVQMNNAAHLLHIAELLNDHEGAEGAFTVLQGNPIYAAAAQTGEEWTKRFDPVMQKLRTA